MQYNIKLPKDYVKPVLPGKTEWVAALRSGEYNQTNSNLCDKKGYCCLGVLSKIQGRLKYDESISIWVDDEHHKCGSLSPSNPVYGMLKGLGTFPADVYVSIGGDTFAVNRLAFLNDDGLDFNQIADIIDAVWD